MSDARRVRGQSVSTPVPGPYREDRAALFGRREALQRRLSALVDLEERKRELEQALEHVEARLSEKRPLALLDGFRVAKPCMERWDRMKGDARVRHCGRCGRSVYDLSAFTAYEAERTLVAHGDDLCARFYLREDGKAMTADCPVGVRRVWVKRVVALLAVGLVLLLYAMTTSSWRP